MTSIDSIASPPNAGATVVTVLITTLNGESPLMSETTPLKVKVLAPFVSSPFVVTYEISTTSFNCNFLPNTPSPNVTL